jgi:hypothetical protein
MYGAGYKYNSQIMGAVTVSTLRNNGDNQNTSIGIWEIWRPTP